MTDDPSPAPALAAPEAPRPDRWSRTRSGTGRRRLALGLAAALVAVAAGGIGYAVLDARGQGGRTAAVGEWPGAALKSAPSSTPVPTPGKSGAYGSRPGGSHYGALSRLLLPMPKSYVPGPDLAEFGNDVELNGRQASALMKESYRGLPAKQRRAAEKAVDRLGVQGIGMRTYSTYSLNGTTDGLVVDIQLVQMRNQRAASAASEFFAEFTKASGGTFRKGPRIAGHDGARCVLPPREAGVELDTMICQATEGDLLVSLTADSTAPLSKDAVAKLLKQQLDRVKAQGEAV